MMNNKIPFYQERNFGDKFNVVFAFVKENWRYMIRYILYGALPLAMFAALSLGKFLSDTLKMQTTQSTPFDAMFFGNYALLLVLSLLSCLWIGSLIFSYIQLYNDRENGLEGITFEDLKPYLKRNAWRMVKCSLVLVLLSLVVLGIIIGGFVINVWWLSLILMALAMIACIPVLMFMPT